MPSVLTVRSSGGATSPILSVWRLNQAIICRGEKAKGKLDRLVRRFECAFKLVYSCVCGSNCQRLAILRSDLKSVKEWDSAQNLNPLRKGQTMSRFIFPAQSDTKPVLTNPHCPPKAELRRASPRNRTCDERPPPRPRCPKVRPEFSSFPGQAESSISTHDHVPKGCLRQVL